MQTKTRITEKKAYHTPELRAFGSVEEGTNTTSLAGNVTDGLTITRTWYTWTISF